MRRLLLCAAFFVLTLGGRALGDNPTPSNPGPCDCYNQTGIITPELVTWHHTWFGFVTDAHPYTPADGESWDIPEYWYGVNALGNGGTCNVGFRFGTPCCGGSQSGVTDCNGNETIDSITVGAFCSAGGTGTGLLSGAQMGASGKVSARVVCSGCPGTCAMVHFHFSQVP
jgi:hypothetical protein